MICSAMGYRSYGGINMALDEKYLGWQNKPTYIIFFWIGGSPMMIAAARGVIESAPDNPADALRDWTRDVMIDGSEWPSTPFGLRADLLTWSLAFVDWRSLVKAILAA